MEFAVGIALAIPSLVEMSIMLGKDLVDKFRTFQNYGSEVDELITVVQSQWLRLEEELKYLASIEDCLEHSLKDCFKKLSNLLCGKFRDIMLKIDEYSRKEKILYKLKFVFFKRILNEAIHELQRRHDSLGDLIYTLTLNSNTMLDQRIKLQSAQFIPPYFAVVTSLREAISTKNNTKRIKGAQINFEHDDNLYWRNRQKIKHTSASILEIPGSRFIIDSIPCSPSERQHRVQDFRQLALVLKSVSPSNFGILNCSGIVELPRTDVSCEIEMVFNVPPRLNAPESLRSLLLMENHNVSLYPIGARIELAKKLARTVLYVHAADFVHKNFRPEMILMFNSDSKNSLGSPFLIGFQKARPAVGFTAYLGDKAWEENIYRHPDRQGEFHQTVYKMEHDVYSLGVCLLEIALWQSFVVWTEDNQPVMTEISDYLLRPSENGKQVRPYEIKARMVKMAEERVPRILGSKYTDVVISCLTCLDAGNDDDDAMTLMGDEHKMEIANPLREETVSVSASYIEKILGKLEEISV
ncbi:uncharacterized protein H6S33_004828 [Morchella sextelata]|uniref:uncharacterized protein n=1 Tax=Morchella sextelata TaxID=1174677 RepID=UPI001D036266|nr:uncharacterized protein H6S33_004828 [Morchella sextelata]KAH0605606.1 hypothetical protein H6S33_004828 [Morchella sextelata]